MAGSHALADKYPPVPASLDLIGTNYELPNLMPQDTKELEGARILFLLADGAELPEFDVPFEYLIQRGADVDVAGQDWIFQYRTPAAHVVLAQWLKPSCVVKANVRMSDVKIENYDAIYIAGGAWNPDMLRGDDSVLRVVRHAHNNKLVTASICHGPQVLITAITRFNVFPKGTQITGTSSIRGDLENAGFAVVSDRATVYDQWANLLTSRDPNDLGPFCLKFGELIKVRMQARPRTVTTRSASGD